MVPTCTPSIHERVLIALFIAILLASACDGGAVSNQEVLSDGEQRTGDAVSCLALCSERACGLSGGCHCGECPDGQACTASGECVAVASCDLVCEAYACGLFFACDCGSCPDGEVCDVAGTCVLDPCVELCGERQCGEVDGCDCGTCTLGVCNSEGQCELATDCSEVCSERECGMLGSCDCGTCPKQHVCLDDGTCYCVPECVGKACGADGCGGTCGDCSGFVCVGGEAASCEADQCLCGCESECLASAKECGPGSTSYRICVEVVPGCLKWSPYLACAPGQVCANGQCNGSCTPNCDGKQCGDDGCGGQCGTCDDGEPCTADECAGGLCVNEPLTPCCADLPSCDDGVPCTNDDCMDGVGCVHTWLEPCCGNGKVEAGEECDDGNYDAVDGCSPLCEVEPYAVYVGFGAPYIDCKVWSDDIMDEKIHAACASAYGSSAIGASVEMVLDGSILWLPELNNSGNTCVFTCPLCEGAEDLVCLEGHRRICLFNGQPWPSSVDGFSNMCSQSTFSAVCVIPLIDLTWD